MCDTLVYRTEEQTLFAKNSDREPGEIQHTCFVPAVRGDNAQTVKATYLDIPQVPDRNALVLSRPFWMWGAEMGVNDQGLVIGNEAVFSKRAAKAGAALLGMDLLRLALERCSRAEEAIHCIGELLKAHGQGGPAGYRDKSFRYDSSFILADPTESWIMETAGKDWVAKKLDRYGAISNAYSLHGHYSLMSDDLSNAPNSQAMDFAKQFDTRFMRTMGCAETRRTQSLSTLKKMESCPVEGILPLAMKHLRSHHTPERGISGGSNRDICMHAASILRPSQTCGSMIVSLKRNQAPRIWLTGTSAPCLSLFQGLEFPELESSLPQVFYKDQQNEQSHWFRFESIHRRALFNGPFRHQLIADRDQTQTRILTLASEGDLKGGQILAEQWHEKWFSKAMETPMSYSRLSPYHQYWRANSKLESVL